ncbi:MAG: DNA methylase [Planctomycetota bacterium]|nr:DNA methylase [Planctomycetota bacterium]
MALREKQIQQNYRPIIAVHKWFARRPGTLFRALLLSEFGQPPLRESFYRSHQFSGLHIADPFMGGGTPLIEANRLGCTVTGCDINPMAYWIVKQEVEHLDIASYLRAAAALRSALGIEIGMLYRTTCLECGTSADVKYFLWVKVQACGKCSAQMDLFPGYLLAENVRHPNNVFVCGGCGELTEVRDRNEPGACRCCGMPLVESGPAKHNRCVCRACGASHPYPDAAQGPPRHRMFAIEYHCRRCRQTRQGRFFKKPDANDLRAFLDAEARWSQMKPRFVPEDGIPSGDETDRLHRWGYHRYSELFNARQLLGLELSCAIVARERELRIRNALATNLSDLLRYQNILCRYDTMALKSLDIFSVHGFPVGLVQCESNLLGIPNGADTASVGSGGWSNIINKFATAKRYCEKPFEVRHSAKRKVQVPIEGEWIGELRNGRPQSERRVVDLSCRNACELELPASCLDGVFTDPPYFGNVQYAELMDFCYVWLRRLAGANDRAFSRASTRHCDELTGNTNMGRGLEHFAEGLSAAFLRMVRALKAGAPFVFTYHHNDLEAYLPIAVAMLDSGLVCSATLPCPAEMSASIHIKGTGSSIVDSVFVCRTTGVVLRRTLTETPSGIARLVNEDVRRLRGGNVHPTRADIRCVTYGHLVRLAVWFLRRGWDRRPPAAERLRAVRRRVELLGRLSAIEAKLDDLTVRPAASPATLVCEAKASYGEKRNEVAF